ncbi:MAG: 1,4-dihydroxy-2-naphthoyl-CoA hydrolase [Actinomycetota bacterium]|nr:1,4-dihydroxy-2-naphthoyl-CoA hydrolase [Actinomycetota bacterium]
MMKSGLTGLLGLEVTQMTRDAVTVTAEVTEALHQPHGLLHGGVHCTLAETAASIGAQLWLGSDGVVVGVSNHTDFLRGMKRGRLEAHATPIHRGRLQQLWQVDIHDGQQRLVATGKVRLQNLTGRRHPDAVPRDDG